MVAEVGLPADGDQQLVDGLNTINAIRASGGFDAKPFALAVADETARRVEQKTAKPPRVRQPAATATDEDVAQGARVAESSTRDRWLHSGNVR